MDVATPAPESSVQHRSWFRSVQGTRYAIELGAIVLIKAALLAVLYFLAFAQPRAPTSPAAMRDHLVESGQGARR